MDSSFALMTKKAYKRTEVIILSTKITASFPNALDEYTQGEQAQEAQYSVEFEAIPKDIIYKPQKFTEKPRIKSIQTAIVCGADQDTSAHANEIDVNEYGEVRVIFHFDQKRPTSCYIPVSNIYSGDGYGAQFLPRVNSEVIVSYINGDIDRPVITGSLHNGENRHAYNLPKEKTKSFIKTQTTPQYEDKEGYNELLFEDRQGEELLSLRAQKDYKLHVLNDAHTHIENNAKTVIDKDSELTVANNATQTVGNDKKVNIVGNSVCIIEKEQLTTIKEDRETHVLGNANSIIRKNQKSIIEKDLIDRIKGTTTQYAEKDAKEKYLQNLYLQVSQKMGIDVTGAYHLNASSIKQKAKTIELEATDGISLKCGGNVLTVDASGIHLKAAVVDTASGNGGVSAAAVSVPKVDKPLYNKLRITGVTASTAHQSDITEVLTYTASVEKYENGSWAATTDLTASQEAQIQWSFIKNNDINDKDILTDNPTDDIIVVNGLEMSVTIQKDNIYKHGHAHCYVVDADDEGYAVTELERYIEVEDILIEILDNNTKKFEAQAVYNVDEITEAEKAMTKWTVEGTDVTDAKGKEIMLFAYEGEKLELSMTACIEESQVDVATAHVNFALSEEDVNGEIEANE
jgi:type VI secretion system secreted protein VgrG